MVKTHTNHYKYPIMNIQFNTDNHIEGTESLESYFSDKISNGLKHFEEHITRVEVHLSDQNADKGGANDIQCKLEARVKGLQPITVTSQDASKEKAVIEAIDKMKSVLRTTMGKLKDK